MSRRGWAEAIGDGIRHDHRVSCARTRDRRPRRRCDCPFSWWRPVAHCSKRTRERSYGTLADAKAAKRAQEVEAHKARRQPPPTRQPVRALNADGDMTVHAYYRRWLLHSEARLSPLTIEARSDAYRKFLHKAFGKLRVVDVEAQLIENWVHDQLGKGRGYRVVEVAFTSLRAMLGTATKKRHIPFNPALLIDYPKPPPRSDRRDHMTVEEYSKLVDACETDAERLWVRLAGEVGLRRGEICGLRSNHFDFDRHEATIQINVIRVAGQSSVEKAPKSGKPRIVAVPVALCDLVRSYVAAEGIQAEGLLFRGQRTGGVERPLAPMTLTRWVNEIMKRAGFVDANGQTVFKLHDLRRTAATLARERGVAEDVIRDQLGHSETAITRDFYLRHRANPRLADFAAMS